MEANSKVEEAMEADSRTMDLVVNREVENMVEDKVTMVPVVCDCLTTMRHSAYSR